MDRSLLSFLICCEMDFLWLTETWLQVAESSSFSKLLPSDCSYFNFPRTINRGGGEASMCKSSIDCEHVWAEPALNLFCAWWSIVHLNINYKNLTSDFSEFLVDIMPIVWPCLNSISHCSSWVFAVVVPRLWNEPHVLGWPQCFQCLNPTSKHTFFPLVFYEPLS